MSAKFKSVASTPLWSRAGPQPSNRLQPSSAKKCKTVVIKEVHILLDKDPNNEDYEQGDEGEPEGEDDKDYLEEEDDVPVEDLDPV